MNGAASDGDGGSRRPSTTRRTRADGAEHPGRGAERRSGRRSRVGQAAADRTAAARKALGPQTFGPGSGRSDKGAEAFHVSPFARFLRAHACSAGGDALFAVALADSIFFSMDPNDARWMVALYLLVTAAPFAVVAPLLGPAMDRLQGGNRFMVIGSAAGRALLVLAVANWRESLLLFPLAFSMLVLGKTHHVAKSALVPGLVRSEEELVAANARLSIMSAVAAGLFGIPGVLLLLIGPTAVLLFAALVFLSGALLALQVPSTRVASAPAEASEKAELRGAGILIAASAMGYVRALVGFLTMLLAFELRGGIDPGPTGPGVELGHRVREALGSNRLDLSSGGAPTWHFGMVLVATGVGGLSGGFLSPKLRATYPEERILAGVLGFMAVAGALGALAGGLVGAMIVAFAVAVSAGAGKQSFDAIVQRDAPEANLGRSFSRFESKFQLLWVFGALIPVVIPLPARIGFLLIAITAGFASVTYWVGRDPAPSVDPDTIERLRDRFRRGQDDGSAGDDVVPEPGIFDELDLDGDLSVERIPTEIMPVVPDGPRPPEHPSPRTVESRPPKRPQRPA